jgi:glycosyltransferase involved in cell wall biosynthesis
MAEVEISAILPVYNDRDALSRAIPRSIEALDRISDGIELIVAEDGSTDGSADLARDSGQRDSRVLLLHSDERLGRGRALTRAIHSSRGAIVCYYDVDLATDLAHLPELVDAIREGAALSTGSRLMPQSNVRRTGGREVASRGYNFLVRQCLGSRVHDHQCGFKAFNRDAVLPLLPQVKAPHWFWDTELLVRAQKAGLRVQEFPVRWKAGKGTTVRAKDVLDMGSNIFKLWWQLHVSKD